MNLACTYLDDDMFSSRARCAWRRPREDRPVAAPFHLLRRTVNPQEIGDVVAFLCSCAASFATGADWAVDGGYSAIGPEQARNRPSQSETS